MGAMPSAPTTRPTLLSRVRDPRDQESWREFDARYRDLIMGYGLRRGLQAADAEDVRQIVMLGLSRSLRRFRYRPELGRFRDYLGRVVHNAVARYASGWRPTPADAGTLDALVEDGAGGPDEVWEREWVHHHFRRAMDRCRRTFAPHTLEAFEHLVAGAEPADVAAAFGVTVDAVHKIRSRVRAELYARIAEQVRAEELAEPR